MAEELALDTAAAARRTEIAAELGLGARGARPTKGCVHGWNLLVPFLPFFLLFLPGASAEVQGHTRRGAKWEH